MSELESMFSEGFAEVEKVFRPSAGAVTITGAGAFSGVSKSCVLSQPILTREQQMVGTKLDYDAVAELLKTDAALLGLYPMEASNESAPRCTVAGRAHERTDVEDDPHDLFVRLHLRARK